MLCYRSARPHTSAATVDHFAIIGWEHLDHPPYISNLALSDFHFFSALKKTVGGQHFTIKADVEAAVYRFVHAHSTLHQNHTFPPAGYVLEVLRAHS